VMTLAICHRYDGGGFVKTTFCREKEMTDNSGAAISREDEVAAVLFGRALTPETLEAMKKRLLGIGGKGKDRPDPNTRLGLVLIALTTPNIAEPSEEELEEALPRVELLLTEEEKHRLEG
jgi:hypothetical protein